MHQIKGPTPPRAAALEPGDVVLGGGNVKKLKKLPPRCRASDNANAFNRRISAVGKCPYRPEAC
jgi:hypothetical protein